MPYRDPTINLSATPQILNTKTKSHLLQSSTSQNTDRITIANDNPIQNCISTEEKKTKEITAIAQTTHILSVLHHPLHHSTHYNPINRILTYRIPSIEPPNQKKIRSMRKTIFTARHSATETSEKRPEDSMIASYKQREPQYRADNHKTPPTIKFKIPMLPHTSQLTPIPGIHHICLQTPDNNRQRRKKSTMHSAIITGHKSNTCNIVTDPRNKIEKQVPTTVEIPLRRQLNDQKHSCFSPSVPIRQRRTTVAFSINARSTPRPKSNHLASPPKYISPTDAATSSPLTPKHHPVSPPPKYFPYPSQERITLGYCFTSINKKSHREKCSMSNDITVNIHESKQRHDEQKLNKNKPPYSAYFFSEKRNIIDNRRRCPDERKLQLTQHSIKSAILIRNTVLQQFKKNENRKLIQPYQSPYDPNSNSAPILEILENKFSRRALTDKQCKNLQTHYPL